MLVSGWLTLASSMYIMLMYSSQTDHLMMWRHHWILQKATHQYGYMPELTYSHMIRWKWLFNYFRNAYKFNDLNCYMTEDQRIDVWYKTKLNGGKGGGWIWYTKSCCPPLITIQNISFILIVFTIWNKKYKLNILTVYKFNISFSFGNRACWKF